VPASTPTPRVVASGLGFLEGPVYLGGGVVASADINGQCVWRYEDGKASVIARTGGGANGATLGPGGEIWVANNGGISLGWRGYWFPPDPIDGRIQRITAEGEVIDVSGDLPGAAPHRPNDLCFGPDGMLYFTDPRNWEDITHLEVGRIWRLDPSTGSAEVLSEVPMFCNGIAFGPEPNALYVAQTMGMKVIRFDWSPTGLGEPRDWVALPVGFPDGFCFSADGDCYVCGATGNVLQVFDADGGLKRTIEFPEHADPTNCCLGDGVLYVTCSGSGELVGFDVGAESLPLYPFRH
jgi:gluconolactonase